MQRNTWQTKVKEFEERSGQTTTLENRVLDLTSEIGELAKEVLRGNSYGKQSFKKTPDWELELGDCLYALCSIANITDCDLEVALDRVIAKYTERLEKKGHAGSN